MIQDNTITRDCQDRKLLASPVDFVLRPTVNANTVQFREAVMWATSPSCDLPEFADLHDHLLIRFREHKVIAMPIISVNARSPLVQTCSRRPSKVSALMRVLG